MKKQKYLTYLNENYFYEIGFEKKESKLKDLKIKKHRQYRSNQGRSPKQQTKNNKMLGWSLLGLFITIILIFITKK